MQSLIRGFIYSVGAILLFVAVGLLLVNLTNPADLAPVHDPIFKISVHKLFWAFSVIGFVVAFVCLFERNTSLQLMLVLGLATSFVTCRLGLFYAGVSGGFKAYLASLADAFGISCNIVDDLLTIMTLYLLVGSLATICLHWMPKARSNLNI